MNTSFFESEINDILEYVKLRTAQKYLNTQIEYPAVLQLKVHLLMLFLHSQSYSNNKIRTICTAASLAQMGLDIHNWITNEQELIGKRNRDRQLHVLAGDYFSSQYYALLSELDEIQTITQIADSIHQINKSKVLLYQLTDRPLDRAKWLNLRADIESLIILGFVPKGSIWTTIMDHFIRLHLLLENQYPQDWNPAYVHRLMGDYSYQIQKLLPSIPSGLIQEELRFLLNQVKEPISESLVAEEI